MKKIISLIVMIIVFLCGCSCDSDDFSIDKFKNFSQMSIKTYSLEYKEYYDDILDLTVSFISKCNNNYCEYYMKKEDSGVVYEYLYKYHDDYYLVTTRQDDVDKGTKQVPLIINDTVFDVNIHVLMNYVKEDIDFYDNQNENFGYKCENKISITEYNSYTSDGNLSLKRINNYLFKEGYIKELISYREDYNPETGDVTSTSKKEFRLKYEDIELPN